MTNNHSESTTIVIDKRSSLSARASKIPQKIVQSSSSLLFSLRPSISTNNNSDSSNTLGTNEGFTKKLGNILFGSPRETSSSTLQPPTNNNTQSRLYYSSSLSKLTNRKLRHTLDIPKRQQEEKQPITYIFSNRNNNNHSSSSSSSSSNSNNNNDNSNNNDSDISPYSATTPECLFFPLSFSNSSVSSISSMFQDKVYTIHELNDLIKEKCKSVTKDDQEELLEDVQSLIHACELDRRFNIDHLRNLSLESKTARILHICQVCSSTKQTALCVASDHYKKELPKVYYKMKRPSSKEYEEMKSDQLVLEGTWFRQYFVGKPYVTLIGCLETANNEKSSRKSNRSSVQSISTITEDTTLGIITIVQEKADKGNMTQYRIIIRSKHSEQARYIVHESTAKDTQNQLELKGESKAMDQINSNKRLLPSFKSSNETSESTRLMRAAILSVCPHLDLRSFKELSAESTILSGLEKELIKYDELQIPKHYKFGLLTIKNGQITEESWFSNTGLSKDLQDFLSIMGHKIQLKGYKGYAAGLDTKTGESGEFAYVSKWRDYDITFHVAAIMPSQANDKQQVLRKKHIGNDIVCIIFIEGNQTFNPKAIRSQFLHVYIVVRPETVHQKRHWRVEVIKHKNVNQFGPPIPSPPLFDDKELKSFLTLKLINAENAALKSDRFFIPNNKARLGLLGNYIQMGLAFNPAETARQSTEKTRPKSANHNHKSRLLHEAHHMEERRRQKLMTTSSVNIPPLIPSISSSSRSTLLTDIKKGFSRKKNEEQMSRKTSKLNITSTPEEDLLIGQDIQVSSESFISPEQLFASSIYEEEIVEQKD